MKPEEFYQNIIVIALEGLDCCFKETNSKALKLYLSNKGYDVILKHFPRYNSECGSFAKRYLEGRYDIGGKYKRNDLDLMRDDLQLISSFYLMDMYDWYTSFRKTYNTKGKKTIIIFDRWFYSMMYYLTKDINLSDKLSMEQRLELSDEVYIAAKTVYGLPEADIIIKMVNDDIEQIEEISKKRKEQQDYYERDRDFLSHVREVYQNMNFTLYASDKFGENSVLTINVAGKSRGEIQNEIFNSKEIKQIDGYKFSK